MPVSNRMTNFRLIKQSVDVSCFIQELDNNSDLWLLNIDRQSKISVQRETQTIYLKKAISSTVPSSKIWNEHDSIWDENSNRFPIISNWVNCFNQEVGGSLGRVLIVRLKPYGRVYRHKDLGDYYKSRDRFHLVLKSDSGSIMTCENERIIMHEGELWWFDNKKNHEAENRSHNWRIHLIFDILGTNFASNVN